MVNKREAIRTINKIVRRLPPAHRPTMVVWYDDCAAMRLAYGVDDDDLLAWCDLSDRVVHICPNAETLDELLKNLLHEIAHLHYDTVGKPQDERKCDRLAARWLRRLKREGLV